MSMLSDATVGMMLYEVVKLFLSLMFIICLLISISLIVEEIQDTETGDKDENVHD